MIRKPSNTYKLVYFSITTVFLIIFNLYCSTYLSAISQDPILFIPGLKLNYMENTGAAFSILQDSKVLLVILGFVALGLILRFVIKNVTDLTMKNLFLASILITGVGCNMYERIAYGFVRDYFELTFINFPVFNISDIFINISVVVIMVMLFNKNYSKR